MVSIETNNLALTHLTAFDYPARDEHTICLQVKHGRLYRRMPPY